MNAPANGIRPLAFYLPQFHPIPENDRHWGAGFTEWHNVTRARPRFRGHEQPHLPTELGFCDLRVPETREAQAELARAHGLAGFVYYHYWFSGRRLLDRPFREVLESGRPDFPFCLCWANEPWTRNWDGLASDILVPQEYSAEDDAAHLRALIPAFCDPRYIRVEGRPLFLVYRASHLPDARATTARWREVAAAHGLELHLCRVEGQPGEEGDPRALGFDAAVDFAPVWRNVPAPLGRTRAARWLQRIGLAPRAHAENYVYAYPDYVHRALAAPEPPYPRYPAVMPGWDNSARRKAGANLFIGRDPALFDVWVRETARRLAVRPPDQRLLFVNAWNEWGEGCHLEPCRTWGRAFLEALARGLRPAPADCP